MSTSSSRWIIPSGKIPVRSILCCFGRGPHEPLYLRFPISAPTRPIVSQQAHRSAAGSFKFWRKNSKIQQLSATGSSSTRELSVSTSVYGSFPLVALHLCFGSECDSKQTVPQSQGGADNEGVSIQSDSKVWDARRSPTGTQVSL